MKRSNILLMAILLGSFAIQANDHATFWNRSKDGTTVIVHTKSSHKQKSGKTRHDEDQFTLKAGEAHEFSCNGNLQKITLMLETGESFFYDGQEFINAIKGNQCLHGRIVLAIDHGSNALYLRIACNDDL